MRQWFIGTENERGQAIVEFALILPILLIILLVPVDFYRCINATMTLNSAVSESLCQLEYSSVANNTVPNDLMSAIRSTYGDKLDVGMVTFKNLDVQSEDTENYTYYVYSSDRADPSNFWNQFEARPSSYQCQNVTVQLTYDLHPITPWGQMFLGSTYQVTSRNFSRALYAGGYTP